MTNQIIKEQYFEHPIHKVWAAITVEEEISTWFIDADFKAKPGYNYTFTSKNEGCQPINGTVKEATPYTLIYTWMVDGTNVETTVKWELKEKNGGTQLYLEHSGIEKYDGDTAIEMFESFSGGWKNCIAGLNDYLTKEIHA